MIKIELTKDEAQILINMINVCVKVEGLNAAEAGILFVKKIHEASNIEVDNK